MIDNWSSDRLMAISAKVATQATVGGTASYNIGTRYSAIEAAAVLTPAPVTPLRVVNAVQWTQIPDRSVAGSFIRLLAQAAGGNVDVVEYSQFNDPEIAALVLTLGMEKQANPGLVQALSKLARLSAGNAFQPRYLFYDRDAVTPTIYVGGAPQNGSIQYVAWTALAQFADAATPLALPPGYTRMLELALAVEIAPQYDVEPTATVMANLKAAMSAVRTLNASILGQEPATANTGAGDAPSAAPASAPYGPSGAAAA